MRELLRGQVILHWYELDKIKPEGLNVVALEEQGDKVSIDKSEQYGQMHFLIWTNKLYNLDQYMLHFYELDKNDPVCEGGC